MSSRWYFKMARMMHTGRLKIPTIRQMVFSIPDWNANPPGQPDDAGGAARHEPLELGPALPAGPPPAEHLTQHERDPEHRYRTK